jgi:hypothetical protein
LVRGLSRLHGGNDFCWSLNTSGQNR